MGDIMDTDRLNRAYSANEVLDIYITTQGDTWDIIALKVYGNERYMGDLLKSNPRLISTIFFGAGVEITCPDIDRREDENLPPWKR